MSTSSLNIEISKPKSKVYRRVFLKRRLSTGLFEDEWQNITQDVKKFGKITKQIDAVRLAQFTQSPVTMVFQNDEGKYNPPSDQNSLWYNYAPRQRSLIKIEAGFSHETTTGGIIRQYEYPSPGAKFDIDKFDERVFDGQNQSIFSGIIWGDIYTSSKNEITFKIAPLVQVLRDYSAKNISGYDDSMTATKFIELVRDHTDGSGSFLFRPFFNNSVGAWEINTTTNIYVNLNTSTAQDVIDQTVWGMIEKFAEAENFIPYITSDGNFKFLDRAALTSSVYAFSGIGDFNHTEGQTIVDIKSYGEKISKYYSRVQVKFKEEDTSGSYSIVESQMQVGGDNLAWLYGEKTYQLENLWISTSTVADVIALNLFNDYSALKNEIDFSTSFIPNLNILDRFTVSYDSTPLAQASLWDLNNWAYDTTDTSQDLIWDDSKGDALKFNDKEFKFLKIDVDLDSLKCDFIGREI